MSYRKFLTLFSIFVILALVLAACGSEDPTEEPAAVQEEPTEAPAEEEAEPEEVAEISPARLAKSLQRP